MTHFYTRTLILAGSLALLTACGEKSAEKDASTDSNNVVQEAKVDEARSDTLEIDTEFAGNLDFYQAWFDSDEIEPITNLTKALREGDYNYRTAIGSNYTIFDKLRLDTSVAPIVGYAPTPEDVDSITRVLSSEQVRSKLPAGIVFKWSHTPQKYYGDNGPGGYALYALRTRGGKPAMSGNIVSRAAVVVDNIKGPLLHIDFTPEAAETFAKVTKENANRNLAIVVNGRVASAPRVLGEIDSGTVDITGYLDENELIELLHKL